MTLTKTAINGNSAFRALKMALKYLLDSAKEQGVDTEKYNLPSTLKEFTKLSKSVTSNKDERFKNLFAAINGNSEFRALKMALKYLLDKQYNTDISELALIFGGET